MSELHKIADLIKERGLKASDCEYHTIRDADDGSVARVLVVKGEPDAYIEYICSECSHHGYLTQEYKKVSKSATIRFKFKCDGCGVLVKISKLKGGKKKKSKE